MPKPSIEQLEINTLTFYYFWLCWDGRHTAFFPPP